TALLFSLPNAAALIAGVPTVAGYAPAFAAFVGSGGALDGSTAFSTRAIGLLHRPMYPDGIGSTPAGPLSKPLASWSVFNVGFHLELVQAQLLAAAGGSTATGCSGLSVATNGVQIFPGGLPIYRSGALIGAVGVSGDGVDQDDMVAFLALANSG